MIHQQNINYNINYKSSTARRRRTTKTTTREPWQQQNNNNNNNNNNISHITLLLSSFGRGGGVAGFAPPPFVFAENKERTEHWSKLKDPKTIVIFCSFSPFSNIALSPKKATTGLSFKRFKNWGLSKFMAFLFWAQEGGTTSWPFWRPPRKGVKIFVFVYLWPLSYFASSPPLKHRCSKKNVFFFLLPSPFI